jgi:hypothetical protein
MAAMAVIVAVMAVIIAAMAMNRRLITVIK